MGVECIHNAVNRMARGKSGRNLKSVGNEPLPFNVNADSSHARGSGGG